MTLHMVRAKDHVRFQWTDGEVDSTVTLLPEDDEGTLLRKLKRVVALAEGERIASAFPPAAPSTSGAVLMGAPQTGNGWAAMVPPEIPEDADYELIPPGEEA